MPIVRAKLRALGLPMNERIDPMTAVTTGAALYASTQPVPIRKTQVTVAVAPPSPSHVALQLDYESTVADTEAPVVIRCSDPRASFAEVTAASGNWTSGRVPLNEGGYVLNVPIVPRKANTFVVRAFTAAGFVLECEPAEFFIQHSVLLAEAPPLPESLWLEVDGVDGDEGKGEGKEILQKNTPLPAKGSVTVRTTKELVRGGGNTVNIKIYEGNSKVLRANQNIFFLPINGDSVPRKLPVGTQIDITVKVDASRRINAGAYIPSVDETYELPKRGERIDITNPHQLEYRRQSLADEVEQLESENSHPDVKVKLELCRRLLWNTEITKALRAAQSGERDCGDAYQRVDEALREVEERLVLLREKEEEHVLPAEWRKQCGWTESAIAADWATEQDRQHFHAVQAQGVSALNRKRWETLRESTRQMNHIGFVIAQRDPEFWHEMAASLPSEPNCYSNSDEARLALARLRQPRSLDELKADVVRLVFLLPNTRGGGVSGYAAGIVASR